MTLPEDFSPFEHLQDTIKRVHNREVREAFSDLGADEFDPDISIPRHSLRVACTIDDNDTQDMMVQRQLLFFLSLRRAQDMQTPVVGDYVNEMHDRRMYKPQITLFFQEDDGDVEAGYNPVRGRISYRLMNESSTTLSKVELTSLANRIQLEFASGNGYVWKRGRDIASYTDKDNGYQLQILTISKAEAKEVINKVLDTNQDTPNWQYLQYKESDDSLSAYPSNPGSHIILGETRKKPRRRPVANVRFQYATADVWGIAKPIVLCDRSFRFIETLAD